MYEAVAEYTGMDYEKVKKRMEAEQRALDTESKANEERLDGSHYGQDGYCPICDWKTIESDWKTDLEIHLAITHAVGGAEIVDMMRRAFESKASEGMWDIFDDNGKCIECGQVIPDNFEKRKAHLESHGINVEKEMDAPSNPNYVDDYEEYIDGSDVPTSGFYESKASEGMAENIWNEWSGLKEDGGVIWEDWREFAIDEGLTDKQIQEQYEKHWGATDKEPVVEPAEWNSLTQGETPYGLGYESEGEDEPEYYDDTPIDVEKLEDVEEEEVFESVEEEEEKLPTDFELEDVKEEDVVVESSEDDYEWEEDYKKFGDYDDNDDPDDEYIDGSDVPKHGHYESNAGTSKAEEAFNKGASAEEIYTLVDTKESEDGRTESEDDYLNNLYNKTTANRSAGFTDLS